jgi:hypothetical protein
MRTRFSIRSVLLLLAAIAGLTLMPDASRCRRARKPRLRPTASTIRTFI